MANANPSQTAADLVRDRIAASPRGRLPWAEVMRLALYEPGVGYYRRGVRRIGRGGDFYTSVSAGPLFGRLLAGFAQQVWEATGRPRSFSVIEQGAHDGTLAADILTACRTLDPAFSAAVGYVIIEPDPLLRHAQEAALRDQPRVSWLPDWGSLPPTPAALFLCNELLDAFSVHRVRWDGKRWMELWVGQQEGATPGALAWVEDVSSDPRLAGEVSLLSKSYPSGYTTDICLEVQPWLSEVAAAPFSGAILVLDYGFPAVEYFAPERSEGTLRRYYRHRMDDDVLDNLGDADLTADVNFTALAEHATDAGMKVAGFIEQGRFLTKLLAADFARNPAPMDAATRRQFHTLTHPSLMGRSFHGLLLTRGLAADALATAEERDAALRRLGLGPGLDI